MGRRSSSTRLLFPLLLCLALVLHPAPASSITLTARQALSSLQASRRQSDVCQQLTRLNPMEPGYTVGSEGGHSDYWNESEEQLQCSGLSVARHEIQNRGLLVPHYSNGHRLFYVLAGRAVGGVVIPGCTPTFHSYTGFGSQQGQSGRGGMSIISRRFGGQQVGSQSQYSQWDEHQKIHEVFSGHVVAVPAGLAAWFYNNGNSPLVLLEVLDNGNLANQLDNYPRTFYLAGSEENLQQGGGAQFQGGRSQKQQGQQGRGTSAAGGSQGRSSRSSRGGQSGGYTVSNNILQGFDTELLAQAFRSNPQTVQKLQSFEDTKGFIVLVEDEFELSLPESDIGQGGSTYGPHGGSGGGIMGPSGQTQESFNGMEQSLCSVRLATNIGNPIHADAYSREAGHVTVLNSLKLPILDNIELSLEKGHLQRNAILAPYWNGNAHELIYAARGSARVQIVDQNGNAVLDDIIQEGQLVLVPQGYASAEVAQDQDFVWISVRTNGNPVTNQIVGENSVLNGIPEDVLSNAFYLNRDEVSQIKRGRAGQSVVLSPGYYSQQQGQQVQQGQQGQESQQGRPRSQIGLAVMNSE